jgi:hypothetical protein
MGERLNPDDFFKPHNDWESPPGLGETSVPVKLYDGEFRYRGTWDAEPEGVCRVRLFHRGNEPPVLVLSELPENASTSVTNMMEVLAAEAIARFCPERFEWEEPAIVLEHYPEERNRRGRIGHHATWDRLSFGSWSPRKIWLGGRERVSLGEPKWHPIPQAEVERLIGRAEAQG